MLSFVKKPIIRKSMIKTHQMSRYKCSKKVDIQNNIMFTRNNVILDTLEKMTNTPFLYNDEEMEDCNILSRNKEIATIYAVIIIVCILYIIITDFFSDKDK
jgi:hypothetical protein